MTVLSPEVFVPLFLIIFYGAGLLLVEFSFRAFLIITLGIIAYFGAAKLTGRFFNNRSIKQLDNDYFERLLLSLLALFVVDIVLKGFLPLSVRAPLYLVVLSAAFYGFGKLRLNLSGMHFTVLGLAMILIYLVPSLVMYGAYGSYLNRTGGLMPAFLVGIGTITTVYGLMKVASQLSNRNLFIMIAAITVVAGPFMAALVGYRAYAIIYIMPLIFQYYLERNSPENVRRGAKALGIIVLIFVYTYFTTSVTRGLIYAVAPLDSPKAPAFVVESMKKGHYTDKDMTLDNSNARSKIITRPFFTYKVFLDVIEASYPWGKSHGKLTLSLMPGATKGRATTINILKKPLSTSFFGLSFLEFGIVGVALYGAILGFALAVASRFREKKVYALLLTIMMLWLDTGPSVWWHWLPFAATFIGFVALLLPQTRQATIQE